MEDHVFENALDRMPIGYTLYKILRNEQGAPYDYTMVKVNSVFEQMTGLRANEVVGKKATEVFSRIEDRVIERISAYDKVALSGEKIQIERYIKPLDRAVVIKICRINQNYLLATCADIPQETGREEETFGYDEELEKLRKENETILDAVQDAVFLVRFDEEQKRAVYIRNNRAHQKKIGTPLWRIQGKTPQEVFGKERGDELEEKYLRCAREKVPLSYEETIALASELHIWETILTPVIKNGRTRYIVGSSREITERKNAEQRIENSLDSIRILFDVLQRPVDSVPEYLSFALRQALKLTKSPAGYLFSYNEDAGTLKLKHCIGDLSKKKEYIPGIAAREYKIESAGVYGEAATARKVVCINDFSPPETTVKHGGVKDFMLKRLLSIPVIENGKVVAVMGVANRETDYLDEDVLQLTILMKNAWAAVQRKIGEELLRKEKEIFKATLLSIGDGILATDDTGKITVMNEVALRMTGFALADAVGKNIDEVFHIIDEKTRQKRENPIRQVLQSRRTVELANRSILIAKDGAERSIEDSAAPIIDAAGRVSGVVFAFRDVTADRQRLDTIQYLSYHDSLTGLYNRAFFEEEIKRLDTRRNLPITIVMADLNGLKLANDAFGHAVGDNLIKKAAQAIRAGCREDDIIARTGGDEFNILLPKTKSEDAEKIVERIRKKCAATKIGSIVLSVSFGWDTKTEPDQDLSEVMRRAEDRMYRRKLFESPSIRGQTIHTITQTLYQMHPAEERHSRRVSELCALIAQALSLSSREVKEVANAGLLHDIGKIALSSRILNSKGKLGDEEWQEIRRHSETGYRILSSALDLADTANYVLAHHERWDGNGYPKGLKGEEIPLASRIIALADAFDVMTSKSLYREALTRREALDEIRQNAGTQFDPVVSEVLLQLAESGKI